ncbi:MAG: Sec-independent protein translocase subunit TatA [Actinobacteria bacterium]|jgi:TatA/E family protein of Tat protein translocase|nr:Sec-independent protein translocase subunit TatA [Actinomycetota bacterium]
MFLREPTHILLIILVLVLLFGAKRLPDSARAIGRSLRIFKGELKNNQGESPNENKDVDGGSADGKKPE